MQGRLIGAVAGAASLATLALAPAATAIEKVPDQVIVQFAESATRSDRTEALEGAETKRIESLGAPGQQLLEITDGDRVGEAIRELEADPAVVHADVNGIDQLQAIPNDGRFGELWGLNNTGQVVESVAGTADADIDAPEAWEIGTGDPATVIAIMDSGADLNHPDLAPQLWQNPGEIAGNGIDDDGNGFVDDVNGYDFAEGDATPSDPDSGHGTHVAGTALARGGDGFGVTGVSQTARLMVLRVCSPGCSQSAQIQAINYAAANGARVLNGSLGGFSATENASRRAAIFSHPEVLHVFSAGNDGANSDNTPSECAPVADPCVYYPCAHAPQGAESVDNLLCVAATTQTDARASFSNFGSTSVDLGAPGRNILSSSLFTRYFTDDFEVNDFATKWPTPGTWSRTASAPFRIQDSVGNYGPNTTNTAYSAPFTLPPGLSSCFLRYFRDVSLGAGDTVTIAVVRASDLVSLVAFGSANGAIGTTTQDAGASLAAGGQMKIRLRLTANADASVAEGALYDNIDLHCVRSDFEFLNGTSMSSPHVTGAAGLLASRNPGAPVGEIRQKLLSTVDPVGGLGGITTSGGRLNVGSAMAAMPAETSLTAGPGEGEEIGGRSAAESRAKDPPGASATFGYSSNDPAAGFQCAVDGGVFGDCPAPSQTVEPLGPGAHSFAVRSVDPRGNVDTTPATRTFAVESDPPQTKIRKGPKRRTGSRKAKFKFKADEATSGFECKIDRKRFRSCRSPKKFKRLARKRHRFQVRAIDSVGNVDPSPARKRWRIKKRR